VAEADRPLLDVLGGSGPCQAEGGEQREGEQGTAHGGTPAEGIDRIMVKLESLSNMENT
jgi:hypothetical protein